MGGGGGEGEGQARPPRPGTAGDERAYDPAFARGYPADPALERLVVAFTRGDYATVRRGCDDLVVRGGDPALVAAARDLGARVRPDRMAHVFLAGTALLIVVLATFALLRSRELDQVRRQVPGATSAARPP